MCRLCVKAQKLLDENIPSILAGAFLMNYTGYPFWSGENTLKEVELFIALSEDERKKHIREVDTNEHCVPLYRKKEKNEKIS
jgi:hypothetical protein